MSNFIPRVFDTYLFEGTLHNISRANFVFDCFGSPILPPNGSSTRASPLDYKTLCGPRNQFLKRQGLKEDRQPFLVHLLSNFPELLKLLDTPCCS
ncbi:hypothetical protein C3L33_04942, partial [Rhododendron williamsianum]